MFGILRHELLARGERAARMSFPDVLGEHVDETHAVVHRALIHRVRREEAVEVVSSEVCDHLRRRHGAYLNVAVGIEPVLGHEVAQQVVVHRIIERHPELEAFPLFRIALVLVLDRERDRLPVDVFDRSHGVGNGLRAHTQRDREGHRREHVRRVVFLVDRLVANDGPACGLHHVDVQTLAAVEAHRLRHDDRRCAGDRNESHFQIGFLDAAALRERILRCRERKERRDRRERGAAAHGLDETAPKRIVRKERAHDCVFHRAAAERFGIVRASKVCVLDSAREIHVMLGNTRMVTARAARTEIHAGIERILERRHRLSPRCMYSRRLCTMHTKRHRPSRHTRSESCFYRRNLFASALRRDGDSHNAGRSSTLSVRRRTECER